MDASIDGHAYIKSAVDIACWDILGKRAGLPIHRLLGGAGSTEIPMNCAVYNGPVGEMSDRIERYRSEGGYRIFSTKPSGEAARDIALYRKLAAIRRDDETFIADANRLWSITDALRVVRSAADQGFNIEQPCGTYEQCLRVRRASGATFTLDESVTNGDVLARAFRDNAADIIHVKLGRIGGLSAARDFIGFCRTAGLSLSWASSGGTEIAYMASLHAAAATDADHLFGLWDCTEFNVREYAAGACKIEDGVARPSAQPGLGIEIDPEMIGQTLGHFP